MKPKPLFLLVLLVSLLMLACGSLPFFADETPEVESIATAENTAEPTNIPEMAPATSTTAPTSVIEASPNDTAQAATPTAIPESSSAVPEAGIMRVGPDDFPDYINPLTGLPVPNPALLDRRPIVAKIPNYPHSVRPQAGISLADHIYEYYLEWGLTRFMAVFYGNDAERFGPIRSGRVFDAHIMRMYNGIFVFNYADDRTLDYFEEIELDERYFALDQRCPPLCRDESINSYNNLFGNTSAVHDFVQTRGVADDRSDLSGNFFSSLNNLEAPVGAEVHITYSYANYAYWRYHDGSGLYVRYQGNTDNVDGNSAQYELHMDALTGQPLTASNVIILMVTHEFFHKSSDTEVFTMDLTGTGTAYVFRDNQAFEARWQRFAENQPLAILDTNGHPFPLKPGTTFFQVINTTSEVGQYDSETWYFDFARPPDPEPEEEE
ncbi:MAG: DUF3048 domain-containing protein [Anaerolineae bacterium]|nr:DUF3048 domain-containing protein [Anaerolineae bacterium]